MLKKIIVFGVITFIILLYGHVLAGPQMNPGKWEITTKTEMTNPDARTGEQTFRPQIHTQCITSDDLIPVRSDDQQECKITDIKTGGNVVTWKMSCGEQNKGVKGSGSATYNGDNMNGVMNLTATPYGTKIKNTFSGRRIGPCDVQATNGPSATSAQTSTTTQETRDPYEVEKEVTEEVRDVGKAAKDEAKQGVIDEVRNEVRGTIRGLFH